MASIITNVSSLVVQNTALKNSSALQQSIERLSSGMRINSAKDDAAGQAIANRMGSQIKGLLQAQRNASDGRSMAETAEGALSEINQRLQRIRELSVQSLSETYTLEDADSIQAEINVNLKEIARLNAQTTFNGKNVLDGSAGNVPIQVGVNDQETLGLYLGKPGFSVDELGLTDLVIRGISGKVTPTDQLLGTASNISLSSGSTSVTFNTAGVTLTSAKLVRSSSGIMFIQGTDAQGKNTYLTAGYGASYNTATGSASVSVSAVTSSPLYADISTLASRTVSGLSYVDNGSAPMSADALVSSGGKYYIQQGTDYFEAELSWGPTGTMQAKVTNPAAQTAIPSPTNVTATPDVDLTSATPTFLDSSGNAVSGAARLVRNGSTYFMEVDNGGGDFRYYAASVSVSSDGGTPAVTVQANTTANNAFTDVATVSGTSYVTIDPDKMQLNYTDNAGQSFANVLARDADGNYVMNLGADGKTATLVKQTDGSMLIKTLNGSGDVQIYYPNSYTAFTDAATGWTTINLRETDDGIRLRNPDNPLAALDAAIARVDARRSQLGATMNRLQSAQNVQSATSTALSTSRSRIEDADYAEEVSKMSRAQIVQQAGNSVLAKSNHQPDAVMSLLQG
ncbi:flagellin N-terminal helical domain-containing protein [Enterobacter soli]|uniref:flagellin N-terminal helical domain-containing protein n=1 Tax=Enterobacter soli TaxID=885040 RepID=UPI0034D012DD